ncbi:unnamed protein product [Durusdinium trenchii]|uniref:Uncharacterized protein n=1 Tax=Durusdinium trenchii TaxID=1381693 RepID=A0ABP0HVX5_9DINO
MGFGVLHDLLLKGGEEPSRWLRNKAWRVVTEFCGTRRRIKRCLTGTVNQIEDSLLRIPTCNILAGRRLDDALQVGARNLQGPTAPATREEKKSILKVEADHSVFRYLLYEALKVPDFEYVTKWFTKAVRHGVVPETPIVNHIIGEARLGQVELEELGTSSRDDRDFQGFSSTSWGTPNLLWIFVQACFSQHFRWPRCRALLLLRTSSIVWYAGPCAKTTPKQPAGMV